jgi:hypothetical protein
MSSHTRYELFSSCYGFLKNVRKITDMPINAYIAIAMNLQTAQKLSENCVKHCTFVDYKSMYVSVMCQDRTVYNTPHK